MAIWLTTLPRLGCFVDDRELASLPNRKRRAALLVHLAVDRETTRELVLQKFWPERSPAQGRHALSQTLYAIRQDLGQEWIEASGSRLRVLPSVNADAVVFAAAAARGDWAAALELYGGRFLEAEYLVNTTGFEGWVESRRQRLAQAHRRACRERINGQREQRDLEGALATAQAWARLDPLEEEAHQRIIELLGLTGEPAEAQRHFNDYERLLEPEGLEPLDDTVAILRNARAAAPVSSGTPPATASVRAETSRTGEATGEFAELLPEFEVTHLLETGSVARVYVAREPALNRLVAVKVMARHLASDETARLRFEREVQAAARIQHPNVATVYRSGRLRDGIPYFVMPYFDSGTLEHRLAAAGALPIEEARALIGQLAGALAAAHRLHIVHRDVRPANILYDRATQRALLADFGIAAVLDVGASATQRLTRPDERLGQPAYVSPEQLRGEVVNERADVYSLGVVAFELLTGGLPFDASTMAEQITATLAGRVKRVSELRPDVPAALDEVVQRCLSVRYEHRPFAADVEQMVR